MSNPFEKAGDIERCMLGRLADRLGCKFITLPSKCPYDSLFEKEGITAMVESKVRSCSSDRYDSAMLEKHKYESLMNLLSKHHSNKAWYVFFFNDNKAIIFNLKNINPVWETKSLMKNTVVNKGYVEKEICYIPFDQGKMMDI